MCGMMAKEETTGATEIDNLGIGDTQFYINPNNIDKYPVMEVNVIPEFPSWTLLLIILIVPTAIMIIYKRRLLKTPMYHS